MFGVSSNPIDLDSLPPIQNEPMWLCMKTGLQVPTGYAENLRYRSGLLKMAEEDAGARADLYAACQASLQFTVMAFGYTLRVHEPDEDGRVRQAVNPHLPFILWPAQQDALARLEACVDNGESAVVIKSRDMGLSWMTCVLAAHRLLFRPDNSLLFLSRKEQVLDLLGGLPAKYPYGPIADPSTLLGKIDYFLSRLPRWLVGKGLARKRLHITNNSNGSRIDGESSNASAGSGDRRTALFVDEAAKIDRLDSIRVSTKDVTACRIFISTPLGPGTEFAKLCTDGTTPVIEFPWYCHPEKGRGRYVRKDDLGRYMVRSPWLDQQEKERSPKEMSQEVLGDQIGSGSTFFDTNIIERCMKEVAKPPKFKMDLGWRAKTTISDSDVIAALRARSPGKVQIVPNPKNPRLKVWCDLFEDEIFGGLLRPDQTKTYTLGVDISTGQGASNSVIVGVCNETRAKVFEWADANTPPFELAKLCCAVSLWCGGARGLPLLVYENNGAVGADVDRLLVRVYTYPRLFRDRSVGGKHDKKVRRLGWRSNPEKKAVLLATYRKALAHNQFLEPSAETLREALNYVYYDSGGIGPAELQHESESAKKTHGDRVIASALGLWGAMSLKYETVAAEKQVGEGELSPEQARKTYWTMLGRRTDHMKELLRKRRDGEIL